MWLTHSRPVSKDPVVKAVLGEHPRYVSGRRAIRKAPNPVLVGWGYRPSTRKSRLWAKTLDIPYQQLEDGFISYLGHPSLGDRRYSLIHDKQGIYYDAKQRSDLDDLLDEADLDEKQITRAKHLRISLTRHGISKYNHTKEAPAGVLDTLENDAIVLIDQTEGDASLAGALADSNDFDRMAEAARARFPGRTLYLKVHPDVLLGKKKGILFERRARYPWLRLLPEHLSNKQLFSKTAHVYTVCSQMGFEALWYGIQVHCFGVPFYAHRGLTSDYKAPIRFRKSVSLDTLIHQTLVVYCHYIHPETGALCEPEDLLPFVIQSIQLAQTPAVETLYAVNFSLWKRLFLRSWLSPYARKITFTRYSVAKRKAGSQDGLLFWGNQYKDFTHPNLMRMEDGFIRSSGLGIDLTLPLSLVIDRQGIYFDATGPSDLETLLAHRDVSEAEQKRAQQLIQLIQEKQISKYNLKQQPLAYPLPDDRKIILIPGQVSSDASIHYGVIDNTDMATVLTETRRNHPDAFIIFRPHPDVLTGERQGFSVEKAKAFCDFIDNNSDLHSTLDAVDEVHVLTSLVGFEALMKGKKVVCYGSPFYAGWGLTIDQSVIERRSRSRNLFELCFLTLIEYPQYRHPTSGLPSTPEGIIHYLVNQGKNANQGVGYMGRLLRKITLLASLLVTANKPYR